MVTFALGYLYFFSFSHYVCCARSSWLTIWYYRTTRDTYDLCAVLNRKLLTLTSTTRKGTFQKYCIDDNHVEIEAMLATDKPTLHWLKDLEENLGQDRERRWTGLYWHALVKTYRATHWVYAVYTNVVPSPISCLIENQTILIFLFSPYKLFRTVTGRCQGKLKVDLLLKGNGLIRGN